MRKLDQEQEILSLAKGLSVDWKQNAVENIVSLCHGKIKRWLKGSGQIASIQDLERLVCNNVKLVFEEIRSDDDLKTIVRKYVQMGEPVFATLMTDLDETTFATLIERRKIDSNSKDRYVAVVDCRGEKLSRRFFTKWHEIAHLLTLNGQLELPLHRSTSEKTPTERLMDVIAGQIGFYGPLFTPIMTEQVALEKGRLTFNAIEQIRQRFSAEASFRATLNACVQRIVAPVLVLDVGMGLKKEEERAVNSRQMELLPATPPKPKLRALKVYSSKAAGTRLKIHPNMQIPSSSLLHKLYFDQDTSGTDEIEGTENLSIWRHSDGSSLAFANVHIEARRIGDSLLAIISPASR